MPFQQYSFSIDQNGLIGILAPSLARDLTPLLLSLAHGNIFSSCRTGPNGLGDEVKTSSAINA